MPKQIKYKESETQGFERFMRLCTRCEKVYYSLQRTSKICPKCFKPNIIEIQKKRKHNA